MNWKGHISVFINGTRYWLAVDPVENKEDKVINILKHVDAMPNPKPRPVHSGGKGV